MNNGARGLFCHPHDSFYNNTWWHNQSIYQLSNNLLGQMHENTHYETYLVLGLWELHLELEKKRERRSVTLQWTVWTVVTFVTRHHQVTVAVGIQKYADCRRTAQAFWNYCYGWMCLAIKSIIINKNAHAFECCSFTNVVSTFNEYVCFNLRKK